MKEEIKSILNQYIEDIVASQSEYEYNCYERGVYPKSTYERIYNTLYNSTWIEEYLIQNGVDTSDFEKWYSIFLEIRESINLSEFVND